MIIWLASYPRSGNTFFRALLYQVYGVLTHEHYTKRPDPENAEAMISILGAPPTDLSLDEMRHAPELYFVKTHEMPEDDSPAIYLVRDGRDALVSHAHFVLQYDEHLPADARPARFEETLRMLVEGDTSFGGWSGNVQAWTARSTRTAIVCFEDLIGKPLDCLRQTMAALGYPLAELQASSIPTFSELQQKVPLFFRKGLVGAWREEMSEELHELFWARHGEVMQIMGYADETPPR